ncbi:MAG TPA: hypothetical protein VFA55_07655 [Candidatus Kapabacteria bacterium]|nr:hypothetical protein [Candidatus Kapabacteria bacterium]
MEIITTLSYVIHIACGTSALLCGAVALSILKGGRQHKRFGRMYFWSMFGVMVSAIALSIIHPNVFLFTIAIFSFYMAYTGRSRTRMKQPGKEGAITTLDWAVSIVALVTGIGMLYRAFTHYGFGMGWNPVLVVFGGLCTFFAVRELQFFMKRNDPQKDKMRWFFDHLARMCGAYIATVTAFVVVNVHFLPFYIPWLGPTVIGSAGITYWTVIYKGKFAKKIPVPNVEG